jgi:ElaB/YqjD/DUF883 family membrane-anchored ribosome-binding protein
MATTRRQKNESAGQVSTISKDFRDVKSATRQMATDGVEALRATTDQFIDEGRARMREWGDTVASRVQDQPVKALLVAAALGFLVGVFVRRH